MDKNRISGTSGCNSYSANAKITKNSIKVLDKGIMATEMGCQDGNIWENDFFARLMDIKSVKVDRDTLHIINSDKKSMFFVRRHLHALERNNWELTKVNDTLFDIKKAYGNINEPQPTITFDFEKNTVGGWDGCNNFGINIKFNGKNYSSGIVSSDARGCYIGWSEKFYGVLGSNKSFVIVGNNLTLTNKKGETLTFKKIE